MGILRKLLGCRRGATAVEFGLVGSIYVLLSLFTLQVSIMIASHVMIDYGVTIATRQIEIGAIAQNDSGRFRTSVCSNALILGSGCIGNLQVYATSSDDISGLQMSPNKMDGTLVSTSFNAGGSGKYVILQTAYQLRNFLIPMLRGFFGNSTPVFQSVSVFLNEPF